MLDVALARRFARRKCRRNPRLASHEDDVIQELCIAQITGENEHTVVSRYARLMTRPVATGVCGADVEFMDQDAAAPVNAHATAELAQLRDHLHDRLLASDVTAFLRHHDGADVSELAAESGWSEAAMRRRLAKCRAAVDEYLEAA